jgi:hypothetical protein
VVERAVVLLTEQLEAKKFCKRKASKRRLDETEETEETDDGVEVSPAGDPPVAGHQVDPLLAGTQITGPQAGQHAPGHVTSTPAVSDETASATSGMASPVVINARLRPGQHGSGAPKPGRSRYIPRNVRRIVAERDGYRCAYVSPDGHRCEQTGAQLEYHHCVPFARGGEASVEGISLRCRRHNDLEACLDFGEEHMAAAKRRSLRGSFLP